MKPITGIVTLVAIAFVWHGCQMQRQGGSHWYVEPADNWQWRACLDGGCGSPTSYNDALWWVTTEGGTKLGKLNTPAKSETFGDNSPIINGNQGSVMINGEPK